ncbi:hypothetical protein LCGC14_2783930 [marine sediment metagenome]|uniref:Uncharacterized protein n=1 Tax=marine sediment metagenome TaxID=412755 RepID=A0A0F8ZEP0_9ZZZZ
MPITIKQDERGYSVFHDGLRQTAFETEAEAIEYKAKLEKELEVLEVIEESLDTLQMSIMNEFDLTADKANEAIQEQASSR